MRKLSLLLSTIALASVSLGACIDIEDPGCTSDDDCRGDRICSSAGICASPEQANVDGDIGPGEDTGVDAPTMQDTADPGVEPVELQTMRVYDECDGDQHIARLSLSPEQSTRCDGVLPARVDIRIEGALDLNQQSPGSITFERGDSGIQVLGCEGSFCVNAREGTINLEFYEPGELVSGSYEFTMLPNDEVTNTIAGQRFEGRFEDLQLNWCNFADRQCRR